MRNFVIWMHNTVTYIPLMFYWVDGLFNVIQAASPKIPGAKGINDAYTQKLLLLLFTQTFISIQKENAVLWEYVYFHVGITSCIQRIFMNQLSWEWFTEGHKEWFGVFKYRLSLGSLLHGNTITCSLMTPVRIAPCPTRKQSDFRQCNKTKPSGGNRLSRAGTSLVLHVLIQYEYIWDHLKNTFVLKL